PGAGRVGSRAGGRRDALDAAISMSRGDAVAAVRRPHEEWQADVRRCTKRRRGGSFNPKWLRPEPVRVRSRGQLVVVPAGAIDGVSEGQRKLGDVRRLPSQRLERPAISQLDRTLGGPGWRG